MQEHVIKVCVCSKHRMLHNRHCSACCANNQFAQQALQCLLCKQPICTTGTAVPVVQTGWLHHIHRHTDTDAETQRHTETRRHRDTVRETETQGTETETETHTCTHTQTHTHTVTDTLGLDSVCSRSIRLNRRKIGFIAHLSKDLRRTCQQEATHAKLLSPKLLSEQVQPTPPCLV